MKLFDAIKFGFKAFRESYLSSESSVTNSITGDTFEDRQARLMRYAVYWASYENTMFRVIHSWAERYRTTFGLYKYVRNIYNPTYRAVEFWKMVIWGGSLSDTAGEDGCIPIKTEHDDIRPAILKTWDNSNWQLNKDVPVLWGTSMGDVAIKIIDDPDKGQVYFENIHPARIADVTLDHRGYVKAYALEEIRMFEGRRVVFRETAERGEGDDVVFKTYKDGELYAWNGRRASWTEMYGFIPFVFIPHISIGGTYGWAEMHAARSKINEVEDLASALHDYIRKAVNPIWLFNFAKPKRDPSFTGQIPTAVTSNPEPGREMTESLYVNSPAAKAQALVTEKVNISEASLECQRLLEELERDFPELQMDIWSAGGYTTGKALKNARKRVERKVIQRRPTYDSNLVRAHQMAIAIGGFRGYEGYDGFNLDSYKAGGLDHSIPATRQIFDIDAFEEINVKQTFWNIIIQARKQTLPIEPILTDLGWSKSKIDDFMAELPDLAEPSTETTNPQDAGDGEQNARISTSTADLLRR